MNRYLIAILLGAITCNYAISHAEIFEPGKRWVWETYSPHFPEITPTQFEVSVTGDTIIDGAIAKKLQLKDLNTPHNSIDYLPATENNGVVSIYLKNEGRFVPMIDYNVSKGQILDIVLTDGEIALSAEVKDVSTFPIGGTERRIITLQYLGDNEPFYWIEDIGATTDNFITGLEIAVSLRKKLIACYQGEKCIYNEHSLDGFSSLEPVKAEIDANHAVYDLMGRPVNTPTKGSLYITSGKVVRW